MRHSQWLPLLALCAGCGQKVDHPDLAPECDPGSEDCNTYRPPQSGSPGGGNEGGADSTDPEGATVSGQVLVYSDDFFDQGLVFNGQADVSAVGSNGSRVEGRYDGSAFELAEVLKASDNWFMVEPDSGEGMMPTITAVDTRIAKSDGYAIGLASELTVDNLFVLLGGERSPLLADLVVTVVDQQGRSVAGVQAQLAAEVIAYREAGGWVTSDAGTDDSGMIFLGNAQATAALSKVTIVLSGAVSARVEARAKAGAITILTAVVSPP
jgi:hypothetical protein